MANMAELVTIPNVPLCETGVDWPASTGPVTFTSDDLLSAAEAPYNDPAIKLPRMRFGHLSGVKSPTESAGGFEEQPCVGKFTNLRLEQDGNLLVADLVGVPKWLAEILPTAYPSRSVEAYFEVNTSTGKHHKMIVASVALLGENLPGVQTLDDLEYLFSDEPTEWIAGLAAETKVAASQNRPGGDPMPQRVAASVDTSDVRSAFYEQVAVDDRYWWWLHQMYLDPAICIAEDENMEYWVIPYSVSGNSVEFEDPVAAQIQWVERDNPQNIMAQAVKASKDAGKMFGHAASTWASADASRPADRQAEYEKKEAKAAMAIDIPALRAATGLTEDQLPDDATEEQINEALAAQSGGGESTESGESGSEGTQVTEETSEEDDSGETEGGESANASAEDNVVRVDKSVWEQTRKGAQAGLELKAQAARAENEAFLSGAIKEGRIAPATKKSYLAQMNGPKNDGNGPAKAEIRKMIEGLEPGVVPVEEIGHSEGETTQTAAQGTGLFPDLERRRAQQAKEA